MIVGVYVKDTIYKNDKLYDYAVPSELEESVMVGSRITVPYGMGNRPKEAIVTQIKETSEAPKLKAIKSVLKTPPVKKELLELAFFMKKRYFCTIYDGVKCMLPPKAMVRFEEGEPILQANKMVKQVAQLVDVTQGVAYAQKLGKRFEKQMEVIAQLQKEGSVDVDLLPSKSAVKTLEKNGILTITTREVSRNPYENMKKGNNKGELLVLSSDQEKATAHIYEKLALGESCCTLLKGVTGSGKTVVFIKGIKAALDKGKTALLLVPEIALTPQMVSIFYDQFGDLVSVLHSKMAVGERNDAYRQICAGEKKIVIGTRLSVFAPLENIGIVILDEEQETTYKSEQTPRYDAKEIAKWRCVQGKALLLLASATPSIESYYYAKTGVYELVELKERFNGKNLPKVTIADMAKEMKNGNRSIFSAPLKEALEKNLKSGEQSILFLNRRGFSTFVSCRECGHVVTCPHCSISLTYHKKSNRLMCHYCGHTQDNPTRCPMCESPYIKYFGTGTQKVEKELQELYPQARVIRMDADTTSKKDAHANLLEQFRQKQGDILIGTQMVVKGLDFENVTFVGVLNADMSLYIEDFRAAQTTFNLITQVVGRSGRGEKEGSALIQTYTPNNSTIVFGANQDYEGFYHEEITMRKAMCYPPFCDLCVITLTGEVEEEVMSTITTIANALSRAVKTEETARMIGPSPCRVIKLKNEYRYRIILKCENNKRMRGIIDSLLKTFYNEKEYKKLNISVDMNPYTFG